MSSLVFKQITQERNNLTDFKAFFLVVLTDFHLLDPIKTWKNYQRVYSNLEADYFTVGTWIVESHNVIFETCPSCGNHNLHTKVFAKFFAYLWRLKSKLTCGNQDESWQR